MNQACVLVNQTMIKHAFRFNIILNAGETTFLFQNEIYGEAY